ncbi:MAG: sigma-54-dependent Fis family transcriptional regulator [Sedimentisphaerales bacterium]|nr:sigma-54-dependent Fis family transcriptional regulator [Sedimentisphaerales bacterium]
MSDKPHILIVEDEQAHAEVMAEALERDYQVTTVHDGRTGLDKYRQGWFDLVITDLKLGGDIDGLGVLEGIRAENRLCEVVMITAHSSIETCKQALRDGAYDYIEKPIDLDLLRTVVARATQKVQLTTENRQLQDRLDEKFGFDGIVGESPTMLRILDTLRRAATSDITVLLRGESGVGKELLANAIHQNSPRKNGPFVPVNCAGLSDSLLESELFGHVKGAFTGAAGDRKGVFAVADDGTLFLDEIGDMPLAMQAKLLRVLEDHTVIPVGSTTGFKVDVRIISATNQNLQEGIEKKKFRQDLYFRIRGVDVEIPPLRQRRGDIEPLLNYFIREFSEKENRPVKGFTPPALRLLKQYEWPGNVRELRNTIKTMVVLAEKEWLDVADLPFEMHHRQGEDETLSQLAGVKLDELEKTAIRRTLELVKGNREQAAKMLGIGERTLYRKIKEYNLT